MPPDLLQVTETSLTLMWSLHSFSAHRNAFSASACKARREGEVKVPAYEALQENGATAQRMMGALLRGVSTRQYEEVLPEMAETAGVSGSSVSRQAIEGSAEQLRQLRERRWDKGWKVPPPGQAPASPVA